MKRQKKDPFADLDAEFKEAIPTLTAEEIRDRIAQVALNQESLMAAKKDDEDLAECREQLREASAVYRDGTKMNKLRIAYCKQVLDDMGK
jgi:hypothetical protein